MKEISRREWLLVSACASAAPFAHSETAVPGVAADKVSIGQTAALTGPFGDLGSELVRGAEACFKAVNAAGGIHGRKLELVSKDDEYKVPKAVENAKSFVDSASVFCLFSSFGTPTNEALLPLLQKAGIPLFAPYSGALSLRAATLNGVFNIRASYPDEAEHLVRHLHTTGVRKIAVLYQNNSFGREILQGATESMAKRGLKPIWTAAVEPDASNAVPASKQAIAVAPEALLLAVAGKSTVEAIKTVNAAKTGIQLYALSVLATAANLRALEGSGRGVVVTQVVPFPTSTLPLARSYRDAMRSAGHTDLNHLSFEGFINAQVLAEALKRAGRQLTWQSFLAAVGGMKQFNVGGLSLAFGNGAASASGFVELTMIDSGGRLIK
jgi:ABC-type branched-subunit amino acid transport system substrate-binding protein